MAEERDLSSVDFGASKEKGSSNLSPREQMIAVIRNGGSTVHKGKHIKHVSQVPSEAELAAGNPQAEAEAAARLKAQAEEIDAQLKQLEAAKKEASTAKDEKAAPDAKASAVKSK
jgi:hypothetical protein